MSKAKNYTKQKSNTLPLIVEENLVIGDETVQSGKVSNWVKDLIAVKNQISDFDHKELYRNRILEKYSNNK